MSNDDQIEPELGPIIQPEPSISIPEVDNDSSDKADELAALEEKVASHWDKLVRAHAEIENVRRRAQVEVANAQKYGFEKFAVELLDVVDSLEQGLATAQAADGAEALVEGMQLTLDKMLSSMAKFAIQPINPAGEKFDATHHEALTMIESSEHESGMVVDVVQRGYLLHDRLIRPARVVVAK